MNYKVKFLIDNGTYVLHIFAKNQGADPCVEKPWIIVCNIQEYVILFCV